jgi:hypothetical protein
MFLEHFNQLCSAIYHCPTMPFADLALARRLEHAEGYACAQFAAGRRKLFPGSGAEWIECGGAYAVFDGIDSPVTQTFGLGVFEEVTPATLDAIEQFFFERRAAVNHEVSPFAGVAALDLLCSRNYRPIELSNVLFREIEVPTADRDPRIGVRGDWSDEAQLWTNISARGWTHEHPELLNFLLGIGTIATAREQSVCFLAEVDGTPGAAAVLCIHDGVALFGGSSTVPELRRRGLQTAILHQRLAICLQARMRLRHDGRRTR